jgi:uncharacterized protein (TIGR02246 family)
MRIAKPACFLLVAVGLIAWAWTSAESQTERKKVVPRLPAKPPAKAGGAPAAPASPKGGAKAPAISPAAAGKDSKADAAAEAAVRKSAEAFTAAYNSADAKAIAEGFIPDGEFVDEGGMVIRGREAIERHFAGLFQELPKAQVRIVVETVRLIASGIAIEEGRVESRPTPEDAAEISHYVALHVRSGDQWLVARTRDYPAETTPGNAHEHLRPLEWLVGEWVDESPQATIQTSCRWAEGKNYLIQEIKAKIGGRADKAGSTRIGWDPLAHQIKSWSFEADGGQSESLWTKAGEDWIIKVRGVTSDGRIMSATNTIKQVDNSTMTWESRDRIVGDDAEEDLGPFTIKRRAPLPAE